MYIQKYMHYNIMCNMGTGEKFCSTTKCIIFVIRGTVLVPEECLCIRIWAVMHHKHTGEAVVTSDKICPILLVTTRPIGHSGGRACI